VDSNGRWQHSTLATFAPLQQVPEGIAAPAFEPTQILPSDEPVPVPDFEIPSAEPFPAQESVPELTMQQSESPESPEPEPPGVGCEDFQPDQPSAGPASDPVRWDRPPPEHWGEGYTQAPSLEPDAPASWGNADWSDQLAPPSAGPAQPQFIPRPKPKTGQRKKQQPEVVDLISEPEAPQPKPKWKGPDRPFKFPPLPNAKQHPNPLGIAKAAPKPKAGAQFPQSFAPRNAAAHPCYPFADLGRVSGRGYRWVNNDPTDAWGPNAPCATMDSRRDLGCRTYPGKDESSRCVWGGCDKRDELYLSSRPDTSPLCKYHLYYDNNPQDVKRCAMWIGSLGRFCSRNEGGQWSLARVPETHGGPGDYFCWQHVEAARKQWNAGGHPSAQTQNKK